MFKRSDLYLSDPWLAAVKHQSEKQGLTFSGLIRRALEEYWINHDLPLPRRRVITSPKSEEIARHA